MPRFAANLSFLFTELPFLDRFEAASKAGFKAVEFLNPFDAPKAEIARAAQSARVDASALQHGPWRLEQRRARHERNSRPRARIRESRAGRTRLRRHVRLHASFRHGRVAPSWCRPPHVCGELEDCGEHVRASRHRRHHRADQHARHSRLFPQPDRRRALNHPRSWRGQCRAAVRLVSPGKSCRATW